MARSRVELTCQQVCTIYKEFTQDRDLLGQRWTSFDALVDLEQDGTYRLLGTNFKAFLRAALQDSNLLGEWKLLCL